MRWSSLQAYEPAYQVSLRLMKEILSHIESADDFRVNSFISILEMMLSDKPNAQGMLNVRRNRDVAQGTGALLSPNDWALGGQYTASTVLTMYKVTGKKAGVDRSCGFPISNCRVILKVVRTDDTGLAGGFGVYTPKGRIAGASNAVVYTTATFALQNACWGSAPNPLNLHFQCRLRLPAGYF